MIRLETIDFRSTMRDINGHVARTATFAMRETQVDTVMRLRRQILDAGMGARLANTWRGGSFPTQRVSVNPAGFIWSNAPAIVDSFLRGATIRPVNGAQYQWIPTKNVPQSRGGVSRRGKRLPGGQMTPDEVENRFNAEFQYRRGRNGTVLAFIDVIAARSGRGYRPDTAGRRRQGRQSKPVLMFVLRRTVRMPRLLDLDGPTRAWADAYVAKFTSGLGE